MKESNEHRKYYSDGTEVPSCTTIVSLLSKPSLTKWANIMGFKKINTDRYLEERAEYGTFCHSQFECYFGNGLMTANTNGTYLNKSEYRELIYKFKIMDMHFSKMGIEIIANELPLEGKTYGGTLDMLAYNPTKTGLIIFDLKTSKQIYDSHWIQLMGYVQLVEEIYKVPVTDVGILLSSQPMFSDELINMKSTKDCWRELQIFNKLRDIYYFMNVSKETICSKEIIDVLDIEGE